MGFIYKVTNDINEKIYVGQTAFSIEERWSEHLKDRLQQKSKNRPLYNAMNKYGIEHFKIEQIDLKNSIMIGDNSEIDNIKLPYLKCMIINNGEE